MNIIILYTLYHFPVLLGKLLFRDYRYYLETTDKGNLKSDVLKHDGRRGRIDSPVLSHLKEYFPLYIIPLRSDLSLSFALNFITGRRY